MIPRRIFWILDLSTLILAFLLAYIFVPGLHPLLGAGGLLQQPWAQPLAIPTGWSGVLPPQSELLWVYLVTAPVTLVALGVLKNHASLLQQSRARIVVGGFLSPLVGLSFGVLIMASLKVDPVSRLFLFSFTFFSALGLIACRLAGRSFFLRRQAAGVYASNVLLVGLPDGIAWMERYFRDNVAPNSHRLIGFLSADGVTADPLPLSSLGSISQLGDLLIHKPIDEVIAIQPASGSEWMAQVVRDCDYFGILLRIVPAALLFGERKSLATLYPFEPLHLPAVVLTPPHWDSDALFLKRLFDMVVASLLLLLLAPVIAVIALILKRSEPDAPVFYPWHVIGRNGAPFTGYKFRTMVPNADAMKADLEQHNEMTGPVFKMKNDPRITPVGRVLRKYSLDEIPQLWSVVKGDMSLVGPRPAGPHELVRYEFWHKRKLSIRPGMTCLWQVRGRNAINNFDEWVKMDLEYIDNWSLWLDFKILVGTASAVVAGTGI